MPFPGATSDCGSADGSGSLWDQMKQNRRMRGCLMSTCSGTDSLFEEKLGREQKEIHVSGSMYGHAEHESSDAQWMRNSEISMRHLPTPVRTTNDARRPFCADHPPSRSVPPRMHTTAVEYKGRKINFTVPADLTFVKGIGLGAYGMVASFKDKRSGKDVAIKKVTRAFDDLADGKRILREVRLLRSFDHPCIVRLIDLAHSQDPDFDDLYLTIDLMNMDLAQLIRSNQPLTEEHYQSFTYQISRALCYLHSAGVAHRDLKPANVLVNKDCTVKLCDFGLARGGMLRELGRGVSPVEEGVNKLTEYVVTRWHRAPEVILMASDYGTSIDIWSVGCILAELIGRKPLFKGKDHLDQVVQIIKTLGSPSEADQAWMRSSSGAVRFVAKYANIANRSWRQILPEASDQAAGALQAILRFNPGQRPSAKGCMRLPYFAGNYHKSDEAVRSSPVEWDFDHFVPDRKKLQERFRKETLDFEREAAAKEDYAATLLRGPRTAREKRT